MPQSCNMTWNVSMAHPGHVVDHEEGGDGDNSAEAEGGHVHLSAQLQGERMVCGSTILLH